jgi:hypothetical protein
MLIKLTTNGILEISLSLTSYACLHFSKVAEKSQQQPVYGMTCDDITTFLSLLLLLLLEKPTIIENERESKSDRLIIVMLGKTG